MKKAATEQIEAFVAAVDPGEETLEIAVVAGRPVSETICNFASGGQVDMIVIGAQGKGALRRLVLGSTMQQVQRLATCPVLAVKDPYALRDSD